MTSYRFHFRPPRPGSGSAGRLFIRIIHDRRYKDIVRDHAITEEEWDPRKRTLLLPLQNCERRYRLLEIQRSMRDDLARLEAVIESAKAGGCFTVGDICHRFLEYRQRDTLKGFADGVALDLISKGQLRTGRAYRSAVRSLTLYTGRNLGLSEVDPSLIRAYEQHLLGRGLKMNTVSFYMRNLRAIYFRAVKAGVISRHSCNPFEDVFTGVYETRRRALEQQELNRLAALENELSRFQPDPEDPHRRTNSLKNALDYFMFSFHSRGMSFVDLAYLKKSEITGDTIVYKRKKTGFFIEVKITRPMQKIINSFRKATKNSQYVFPILREGGVPERTQYESGLNRQNRILKELASMAGISKTLSTHVARHTWATLAKRMGYSIPLISEGLGHRDIKVTSTYLASFERSALDELSTRMSRSVKAA